MMLGILYILQHEAYKDVSLITKNNSKMHLIDYWCPQVILIVTLICKVFR